MTTKATSVIDYLVQRLADEGISDCFGVPGYERVRGAAMLSTTYAVGELSAINGVMDVNYGRAVERDSKQSGGA